MDGEQAITRPLILTALAEQVSHWNFILIPKLCHIHLTAHSISTLDWLIDYVIFEKLAHCDNSYARQRLGFNAPNIMLMQLTRY